MEAREAHNLEVNGSNPFSVNGGEAKNSEVAQRFSVSGS